MRNITKPWLLLPKKGQMFQALLQRLVANKQTEPVVNIHYELEQVGSKK